MLWIQILRNISFMSPPEGHQQEILSIRRGGWCVPGHFRHTTLSGGTAMSLADLLELTMLRSFGNHHLRVYLHTLNFPGTLSSLAGLSTCLGASSSTRCLDTIRRLCFVCIGGWKGSIFFTASSTLHPQQIPPTKEKMPKTYPSTTPPRGCIVFVFIWAMASHEEHYNRRDSFSLFIIID